jgi:hypothetical protein
MWMPGICPVVAQLVHDYVVDKGSIRIQHRRVMGLAHLQLRGVVHAQPLHGSQRSGPAKLDVSHVRDVEEADAGAHGHVLGDQAGVLDWHIPSAEVDHLRLVGAVGRV